MCFGDSKESKRVETTTTLPGYLKSASEWNVNNVKNMAATPYQAYDGQRVADFTGDQNTAFDMIRQLAGADNPYLGDIESLFKQYGSAPAQQLDTPSILGGGYDARAGSLSDYMNPYIDAVLNPQIRAIERTGQQARNRNATAATMEGAYGDSRHGVMDAAQVRDENQLITDTTGRAYAGAFDAAGNLRSKDVSNLMQTDSSNAALMEQAIARMLGGGNAMMGLDKYQTGRELDLARALDTTGQEQQKNQQDKLNAMYEEFIRGQNWGPEMAKLLASVTASMPYEKSQTSTTYEPDNSGWQMLGSLGGTALKMALAPMTGGLSMFMPTTLGGNSTGASHTPGSYSSAFPMPI